MDLDCILGIPPQGLHHNVLLYPFEEHLYVPSVPIQDGHFYCANLEVVSDEHYFFTRLLIIVADCPERIRVKCMSLWLSQTNGKVTSNTILAGEVFSMTNNLVFHVVLRSGSPIGSSQMEAKELIEVNIGLVHHIEGKRLWRSQFKFIAVMPSVMWMFAGILPRKSSRVCIFTAPLLYFPKVHVASLTLVEIVVESRE